MTTRIYVGTYAKYNEGNIFGKWMNLEDYQGKEQFLGACGELHADEDDPEFMFQDWEGIPDDLISESYLNPAAWEYMQACEEFGEGEVAAYVELFNEWSREGFQDRYHGKYESWKDMATEFLEETGELDKIPDNLRYYFDYEAYARDIRLNGDMVEHNGYFFWNQ